MLSKIIPLVRVANFRNFFALTLVAVCLFLNISCAIDDGDTYLYDKTGFDVGASPQMRDPNAATTRVAPDYYYRQPTYAPPSPYMQPQTYQPQPYAVAPQQSYAPQPYQQAPAAYYAPPSAIPAAQADVGGSRYYTNPYAIPPSAQAPRYDGDQFYVPPIYRNNIEPQVPQGRSVSY